MTDLDELERLAKAATPGPWASGIDEDDADVVIARAKPLNDTLLIMVRVVGHPSDQPERDAAYIAAVFPDVVLGLIEQVRDATDRMGRAIG